MHTYTTLTDILSGNRMVTDKGITFIENHNQETFVSYQSLFHNALIRLYHFQARGLKPGDEMIFQVEDLQEFIISFWAGILGGIIPVPLAVPVRAADEHYRSLLKIRERLENPYILTTPGILANIREYIDKVYSPPDSTYDFNTITQAITERTLFIDSLQKGGQPGQIHEGKPSDIAFIQFSSGSTGHPKGVVLTHENILANINAIIQGIEGNAADISLSWMPLTHDMGLIGFHLVPMAGGAHHYLMPVSLFARRPLLWLEKASEHKATVLGSPDFGLKLFLSAFKPDQEYQWDLSPIRLVFNGAEPINDSLCKSFVQNLVKYKLRENATFPVYGLAEATLAVTLPGLNEELKTVTVPRSRLKIGDRVEPLEPGENNDRAVRFVEVGTPVANCCVKIVDSLCNEVKDNTIGHILIKGKNVTSNYYKDDRETQRTITPDGWLNTGDLGFLRKGRLVVTGREKDIVVINGQNYYLHDLERLAEESQGLNPRKITICSIYNPATREEELYAFLVYKKPVEELLTLGRRLMDDMYKKLGITLKYVIPVDHLPFTTSGKRMRHLLVEKYQKGEFAGIIAELLKARTNSKKKPIPSAGISIIAAIEAQLLTIVAKLLKNDTQHIDIHKIDIHDNLSEYGFDSLKLPLLLSEVEKIYPGRIQLIDCFSHPTISEMAALIAERNNKKVFAGVQMLHGRFFQKEPPGPEAKVKKLALIFPGQGSQHVGMGRDICKYFPAASRTFEEAGDILHMDLKALCIDGDNQELTRTENAQPALLTLSVAKYRVFQQELDIKPYLGAGHSLGEYSALVCSRAISFADALKLVRVRGESMREAAQNGLGGMMAVSGLDREFIEEECKKWSGDHRQVVVANYNSPQQLVISGYKEVLVKIGEVFARRGGQVVSLNVSAAFHSPLMEESARRFQEELAKYTFRSPDWPVLANTDARPYKDSAEIPVLLTKQITHPIQWEATMNYMKRQGVEVAIELGPKHVLKDLMKKSCKSIVVYSTNTQEDLQELYQIDPGDFIDRRPNFLARCLAAAVCTPNRNFNEEQFQTGVIEPYREIKTLYTQLAAEKKEPGVMHMKKAAALLQEIFNTKGVPEEEKRKQFNRIFAETETQDLFADFQLEPVPLVETLIPSVRFTEGNRNNEGPGLRLRDLELDLGSEPIPVPGLFFAEKTAERAAPMEAAEAAETGPGTDIAVIGIAVRTALADNANQFWDNLVQGKDCIMEIPDTRQPDVDRFFPYLYHIKVDAAGKKNKKRYLNAAYLKEIDGFDHLFFKLSPREASLMDPCQRIFLETAYHVLEDAGYAGKNATQYETGVYVGYSDDAKINYLQMIGHIEPGSIPMAIAGNLSSIVPGRISYFMDLTGPSILVDTACSSSLVAVHLACQGIRNGDCEQAIAGGVRVNLMPLAYTQATRVGIESSDGKTRTFDDSADGTGVGEGAAAVLLKPLHKAIADRDHIYAIVKGSAMNQDGQSLGITAPKADAQTRVIVKAWKNAGIDPATISYIEAHGTATRLGDPIEIQALTNAFKQFTRKKQFCGVGSVKTNIGHLFEAAGIFGFIKAVLALVHRCLPSVLHFNCPNQAIPFEETPLYVNAELREWESHGHPLRCGVTAFGFSGTNCHVVLEEAPRALSASRSHLLKTKSQESGADVKSTLVLSAKSKEALHQQVKNYKNFLTQHKDLSLSDLGYTAAVGRTHFNHRLAVTAADRDDLLARLEKISGLDVNQFQTLGQESGGTIYYGELKNLHHTNKKLFQGVQGGGFLEKSPPDCQRQEEICLQYIRGFDLDWEAFYKDMNVRKISLPLYPFEWKRCWLDIPAYEEKRTGTLEGKLFFKMEWHEEVLETPGTGRASDINVNVETPGIIIIVKGETRLSRQIAAAVRREGRQVVEVALGRNFLSLGNDCYEVDGSEEHYEKLLSLLKGTSIDKIIFLAALVEEQAITSLSRLHQHEKRGVYNLFHLTKMILKHYSTEKIEYVVIADDVNSVTGSEKRIKPENAPVLGLANAIDRECENITTRCIDIDEKVTLEQVMAEIKSAKQYRQAAYRDRRRYCERLIPIEIEEIEDDRIEIKDTGVYLITGGTGGIGLEIGKYLAGQKPGVHIALVNRSPMPERLHWEKILEDHEDKRTCNKIKAVQEIEAMGGHVYLFQADCARFRQMKGILVQLREKFGKINGIIHSAGKEGEGLLVRKNEKKFTNVLSSKVSGTWILDYLTRGDRLDFLVLFSSVATFLMNPGQTDYTAANAYLDSYAYYRSRQGKKTLAVNWVTWKETGMAVNFNANFDIIFKAIPTAQAIEAFDRVLKKKMNQVLIGELNIYSKLINLLKNAQFQLAGPIAAIIDTAENPLKFHSPDEQRKKVRKVRLTGRETEQYSKSELLAARVWGEVLGFEELRIDDNFYELGGDSILATQVVNRINAENNLKISLIEIFNYETIVDLARYVESLL